MKLKHVTVQVKMLHTCSHKVKEEITLYKEKTGGGEVAMVRPQLNENNYKQQIIL